MVKSQLLNQLICEQVQKHFSSINCSQLTAHRCELNSCNAGNWLWALDHLFSYLMIPGYYWLNSECISGCHSACSTLWRTGSDQPNFDRHLQLHGQLGPMPYIGSCDIRGMLASSAVGPALDKSRLPLGPIQHSET